MSVVPHDDAPVRVPGGLFESVRTLLGTLVAMARTRAELLGNELEQELRRTVRVFVGAMIALALASLALLFAALTLVASFSETHRVAATAAVAAAFVILAVAACIVTVRRGQRAPLLLAATLGELERDLERLRPRAP